MLIRGTLLRHRKTGGDYIVLATFYAPFNLKDDGRYYLDIEGGEAEFLEQRGSAQGLPVIVQIDDEKDRDEEIGMWHLYAQRGSNPLHFCRPADEFETEIEDGRFEALGPVREIELKAALEAMSAVQGQQLEGA